MSSTTFILIGVTYYIISVIIIIVVLNYINRKDKKKYEQEINTLERDKNLIISAGILTELNKVEGLINNDLMQEIYEDWRSRFKNIKEVEIPKITDELLEIQELFDHKKYKDLEKKLAKTELDIYYIKSKTNYLLNEIKDITLSEDRNREIVTKLKAKYRSIIAKYNNNKKEYQEVMAPIELQFENTDKLFSAFEVAMENNNYQEVSKIVKALENIVGNLELVIDEAPSIILMGTKLIPKKMKDVYIEADNMRKSGYNLDYLNIEYNCEESNKKITEVLEKLNVLNIEDSTLNLKTILDYFDSLYNEFNKEKLARKSFSELSRTILVKANKYERINNDLYKKGEEFKYSYDLKDEDLKIIDVIRDEIKGIKHDYEEIITASRTKSFAYSRLNKEMVALNVRLKKCEEKIDYAINTIGTLKEDEIRAREQLSSIKDILRKAKEKITSYKLPAIPKDYYVELAEAAQSINEVTKELNKHPISIKTLNIRIDTARDLVLKVYNTSKEIVKTAYMAEMSVVYGNRYRPVNKDIDLGLTKAENLFYKGNYKVALEQAINAINQVEPNFYETLLKTFETK